MSVTRQSLRLRERMRRWQGLRMLERIRRWQILQMSERIRRLPSLRQSEHIVTGRVFDRVKISVAGRALE